MLGVGNEERFFEKAVVMKNRIDCGLGMRWLLMISYLGETVA